MEYRGVVVSEFLACPTPYAVNCVGVGEKVTIPSNLHWVVSETEAYLPGKVLGKVTIDLNKTGSRKSCKYFWAFLIFPGQFRGFHQIPRFFLR